MIFTLYKNEGETPLECIRRFSKENPDIKDEKMTYAGRLDPMAEGVLVILSGEDTKKKDEFLSLDKEYEFEILWGISSDSFDILGMPYLGGASPTEKEIDEAVYNLPPKINLPYPPFSSKTILGKPLFEWFRSGRISEIELPEREMEVEKIEIIDNKEIESSKLLKEINFRIGRVGGDFRQEKIISEWKKVLTERENQQFKISKLKAIVSSGTYIRSLAEYLGKEVGIGALALSIKRIRVGNYS